MRIVLVWLFLSGGLLAQPWVVAHRGGVRLGAENTLQTFARAREVGVDAIELDIHQSRDGALVVIHDETLDRTYAVPGRVGEMTLRELREIGVPTLGEAAAVAGDCRLFVEIKHPKGTRYEGIEERLLEVLREHDLLDSAVVISFDATSLKRLRELEPGLATAYLTGKYVEPARVKAEIGATYYSPHYSKVDEALCAQLREAGLKLSVWTVNDVEAMRAMLKLPGCDAITTDDPARLLEIQKSP